jgi:hypothetical protein
MASTEAYYLQGQAGGEVLDDGNVNSKTVRWIQVVRTARLSIDEMKSNIKFPATLSGIDLPVGMGIGGEFQAGSVMVDEGTVICYFS